MNTLDRHCTCGSPACAAREARGRLAFCQWGTKAKRSAMQRMFSGRRIEADLAKQGFMRNANNGRGES